MTSPAGVRDGLLVRRRLATRGRRRGGGERSILLPVGAGATSRRTQRWAVRSAALVLALLAVGLSLPDPQDRSPAPTSPGTSRSSQPGSTGDERSSGMDGEGGSQGGRGSRGEVL